MKKIGNNMVKKNPLPGDYIPRVKIELDND
jgi:hypothetical protein